MPEGQAGTLRALGTLALLTACGRSLAIGVNSDLTDSNGL